MKTILIIVGLIVSYVLIRSVLLDNYAIIARNITSIYLILSEKYSDKFPTQDYLLLTAGAINTASYLESKKFDDRHLKLALSLSQFNECGVTGIPRTNIFDEDFSKNFCSNKIGILLPFIMNIEALIMTTDSKYNPSLIIKTIISKRNVIERMITKTIKNYEKGKRDKNWEVACIAFMSSEKAKWIRDKILFHDN